ncbi:MAG: TIGR00297 family protein [Halobacteriaceae archaeon]
MTTSLRRAVAFAAVATLAVAGPTLGPATVLPFGLVAVLAFATTGGVVFEFFATPADRHVGRLVGLASFSLGIAALALLTAAMDLPVVVFVGTVLLVGYGEVGAQVATRVRSAPVVGVTGFLAAAVVAGVAGQLTAGWLATGPLAATAVFDGALSGLPLDLAPTAGARQPALPVVVFLATAGATLAALLRSVLAAREDPLVLVAVALFLWLFADVGVTVDTQGIVVAVAVTAGLGYVSWALDTASIPGMLTGVLLSLLTVVLGGYGWFVVLVAFFGIGGLASKFRYEQKVERGVAEPRGGARGSGNVLGNAAPALVAVVLYAAHARLGVPGEVFRLAFAGSLATALGDTLSSEVGGLYDDPRLITTLERVEPGTDGAVTWQGQVAGIAGAGLVAGLSFLLFGLGAGSAALVLVAGVVGMTVDSLLGALVEGRYVGNQSVNFLATAAGAVAGAVFALFGG